MYLLGLCRLRLAKLRFITRQMSGRSHCAVLQQLMAATPSEFPNAHPPDTAKCGLFKTLAIAQPAPIIAQEQVLKSGIPGRKEYIEGSNPSLSARPLFFLCLKAMCAKMSASIAEVAHGRITSSSLDETGSDCDRMDVLPGRIRCTWPYQAQCRQSPRGRTTPRRGRLLHRLACRRQTLQSDSRQGCD